MSQANKRSGKSSSHGSRDRERARERADERNRTSDAPANEQNDHEERLDAIVEESFPASDPPASTSMGPSGTEPVAAAGGIPWLRDVEQGLAEARATGLPVLLDFSAAPT